MSSSASMSTTTMSSMSTTTVPSMSTTTVFTVSPMASTSATTCTTNTCGNCNYNRISVAIITVFRLLYHILNQKLFLQLLSKFLGSLGVFFLILCWKIIRVVHKSSENLQHIFFVFSWVLHVRVPHEISKLIWYDYFMWVTFAHVKKSHIVVIRCFECKLFIRKLFYKSILSKTCINEPLRCRVSFLVIMGMKFVYAVNCTKIKIIFIIFLNVLQICCNKALQFPCTCCKQLILVNIYHSLQIVLEESFKLYSQYWIETSELSPLICAQTPTHQIYIITSLSSSLNKD